MRFLHCPLFLCCNLFADLALSYGVESMCAFVCVLQDDDDLQVEQSVPLLAGDPPTSRVYPAMSARLKPSSKAGGGRTNPCTGLAMWLAGCCGLRSAGPSGGRPGAPAEIQSYSDFALLEELPVLERFRQILAERCDFDLPEHEALLQDLRRKLRPASGTSGEGFDWRTLGFQSRNSRTDFRGAGLAGLRCLNYLATHYAPEYAQYVALANQATREGVCASAGVCCMVYFLAKLSRAVSVIPLPWLCRKFWARRRFISLQRQRFGLCVGVGESVATFFETTAPQPRLRVRYSAAKSVRSG